MECACIPNNGPAFTKQPHMIPGYMGYVPQYKYKCGNTFANQTHKLFLDPCVNMSPRAVLTDICPEDCANKGILQNATGFRFGECGCNDPWNCGREPAFYQGRNRGQGTQVPRFQTIMNHTYAPFCNRFCTKTFEQDQWRDKLFQREKKALEGWRYCYKSKAWERPDRLKPWDGDHAEFRKTQTTMLPPMMKEDIDIHLRGYDGVQTAGGECGSPFPVSSVTYNSDSGTNEATYGGSAGDSVGFSNSSNSKANWKFKNCNECPPCEEYRRYYRGLEKTEADVGLKGVVKHPLYCEPQAFYDPIEFEDLLDLEANAPDSVTDGIMEEMGELPILTLHKLAEKKEKASGKFYPEERGLARVCNPVGSSYLTARPFRCNPIYRFCEPVNAKFTGHVPGETFIVGENRGYSTRNALKYMTYRI